MSERTLTLFDSATRAAVMYFDGGSRGNPGPAAWGFTIVGEDGTPLAALGKTIGVATNNVAEYGGLIAGLERALELGVTSLAVHGDSKLVIEQMADDVAALLGVLGIERADVMGWSVAKVKNEIHRGRLQLRAQLLRYLGGSL